MYEYVPKEKYKPIMDSINVQLLKLKKILNKEENINFFWDFVGSTNRYGKVFVTQIVNGNKGFDFDVNIYLNTTSKDKYWKASYIQQIFRKYIDSIFVSQGYEFSSVRNSVFKVKK